MSYTIRIKGWRLCFIRMLCLVLSFLILQISMPVTVSAVVKNKDTSFTKVSKLEDQSTWDGGSGSTMGNDIEGQAGDPPSLSDKNDGNKNQKENQGDNLSDNKQGKSDNQNQKINDKLSEQKVRQKRSVIQKTPNLPAPEGPIYMSPVKTRNPQYGEPSSPAGDTTTTDNPEPMIGEEPINGQNLGGSGITTESADVLPPPNPPTVKKAPVKAGGPDPFLVAMGVVAIAGGAGLLLATAMGGISGLGTTQYYLYPSSSAVRSGVVNSNWRGGPYSSSSACESANQSYFSGYGSCRTY